MSDRDQRPSSDQRNNATFAALTMVLTVVLGFIVLVAFVIPDLLWFILVPAGLGLMMVLQYLLWGRWLTKTLQDQQTSTEAAFNETASKPNGIVEQSAE
jgi:hypothetical protein